MRIAAVIVGIIGAIGALFLGFTWYSDLNSEMGQVAAALDSGGALAGLTRATYALLACGAVGAIASIVLATGKVNKVILAVMLVICGGLPLVFATKALFGVPMIIAGALAFAVKPKAAPARPAGAAAAA